MWMFFPWKVKQKLFPASDYRPTTPHRRILYFSLMTRLPRQPDPFITRTLYMSDVHLAGWFVEGRFIISTGRGEAGSKQKHHPRLVCVLWGMCRHGPVWEKNPLPHHSLVPTCVCVRTCCFLNGSHPPVFPSGELEGGREKKMEEKMGMVEV